MLSLQLDLDKVTARGLDGDGLPPMGKGGRIYTFEVEYLNAGVKFVHKFQALSSSDIAKWKVAILGNAKDLAKPTLATPGLEPEPEPAPSAPIEDDDDEGL
jgi:hypothetical protein